MQTDPGHSEAPATVKLGGWRQQGGAGEERAWDLGRGSRDGVDTMDFC